MPVVPAGSGSTTTTDPSSCMSDKWLCVDGVEVANACRTLAYLTRIGHPLVRNCAGMCCCTDGTYFTPEIDDAPWYDPAIPESADVLGVWLEELTTASPYTRTMRARQWGGTLSSVRWGPREIHLSGWVFTRSAIATEYAKQWLLEALASIDNGQCSLPDVVLFRAAGSTDLDRHERTARRVGLIDYKDDVEPDLNPCWGFKFDATMSAETPFLYGRPVEAFTGSVLDPASVAECNVCNPHPVPSGRPCKCGAMLNPVRAVVDNGFDDGYCKPVMVRRKFMGIPPTPYWQSATAIITVKVGAGRTLVNGKGLKNLRIAAFQNPLGLTVPQLGTQSYRDYFLAQDPCMEFEVSCLPYGSELTIDGTVRNATLNCGGAPLSGYGYLSSNGSAFQWPGFGCNGLMLCIETDNWHTPSDATVHIQYVPRDRR